MASSRDPWDRRTSASSDELWPSVHDAYAFVIPSYQMLAGRFEAADNRLTSFLTFAATLTLGAPLFARTVRPAISFQSGWFNLAMICFLLVVGIGIAGRLRGRLVLPDPQRIYRELLHKSRWEFRKDVLYWAGEHFNRNADPPLRLAIRSSLGTGQAHWL